MAFYRSLLKLFNPFTPKIQTVILPNAWHNFFLETRHKNLVLQQDSTPLLISLFVLITLFQDNVLQVRKSHSLVNYGNLRI